MSATPDFSISLCYYNFILFPSFFLTLNNVDIVLQSEIFLIQAKYFPISSSQK